MALSFTPPIHPGEVLREEFLAPLGLKPYSVAKRLHVPRTRIERLVAERTPVTPDTALRLAKLFGTTPSFWLNMQTSYDLSVEAASLREEIDAIETLDAA
nr:HigA family addiction module antitoxin [Mesorhizobium sp.]